MAPVKTHAITVTLRNSLLHIYDIDVNGQVIGYVTHAETDQGDMLHYLVDDKHVYLKKSPLAISSVTKISDVLRVKSKLEASKGLFAVRHNGNIKTYNDVNALAQDYNGGSIGFIIDDEFYVPHMRMSHFIYVLYRSCSLTADNAINVLSRQQNPIEQYKSFFNNVGGISCPSCKTCKLNDECIICKLLEKSKPAEVVRTTTVEAQTISKDFDTNRILSSLNSRRAPSAY